MRKIGQNLVVWATEMKYFRVFGWFSASGRSTLNRGHEHQRLIRRCNARDGRPRCFGGTQRGSGT